MSAHDSRSHFECDVTASFMNAATQLLLRPPSYTPYGTYYFICV